MLRLLENGHHSNKNAMMVVRKEDHAYHDAKGVHQGTFQHLLLGYNAVEREWYENASILSEQIIRKSKFEEILLRKGT